MNPQLFGHFKVRCIKPNYVEECIPEGYLEIGTIYTVISVERGSDLIVGYFLKEKPLIRGGLSYAWNTMFFERI